MVLCSCSALLSTINYSRFELALWARQKKSQPEVTATHNSLAGPLGRLKIFWQPRPAIKPLPDAMDQLKISSGQGPLKICCDIRPQPNKISHILKSHI